MFGREVKMPLAAPVRVLAAPVKIQLFANEACRTAEDGASPRVYIQVLHTSPI